MSLQARVKALEKQRGGHAGKITLQLADGSTRSGDLLDAVLYHTEAAAKDLPEITGYTYHGGQLPAGNIWSQFYKDLHRIRDG